MYVKCVSLSACLSILKQVEMGGDPEANENVKAQNEPSENKQTENTNSNEAKDSTKVSNYIQNIKISNSSNGLVLTEKDSKLSLTKEAPLLTDSKTVVRFSPAWKQTLAASAAILMTFSSGLTSGYSAILLPQLKEPDSIIPWDESTASWIAAMAALPMAPGCLLSGWMMEKFGRRNSHYIVCAPLLVGWILIACANNLLLMLIGRFLTGLCVGLLGPLGPVYIGETSEPKFRGIFLAGVSLAIAVGILVAHLIGTFISWQWTAVICCLFPILSVILLSAVPESPTWLICRGEVEKGVKSYYWLRGYSEEAKAELLAVIDKRKQTDSEPVPTWREKIANLKSPELLKPLAIMIIFFITCQFSGVNAIAFYSIEIVEKAVGKGMDHYVAMLAIDVLRTVMSVVACVICKQYGRRPLCFISGIWTALSMIGLALFLYFTEGKPTDMSWLPLSCLMIYICAISIGLVPLPWMMCGEVFPTKVRGLGSGISSATTFLAFFVVVKTAPGMMSSLGEVFTFLFYGIIAFIGTVILYFILPETKGKSLQEIEDKFRGIKSNKV
ncbi:PREDICTED: facilitated trehalose transporter Tret1-2 homolog isoform X1 [Papilio polytes]|uniref:facilitated trehalose transporter Tret1-2 homolog isoform X1 n=2 Tax=Papilio polytes TaxID=76194 RepID=UPI000675F781|nr:PREDICTED: facilitated trehalose transporter Tret1-2 homolog isoform X1 [Papilio polytes]